MDNIAYLLDDGILLKGIIKRKFQKKIFVPNNKKCGFDYQYINKDDIGKTLFLSISQIMNCNLYHLKIIE